MAKPLPISYPQRATAEQRIAFRLIADEMKKQGLSSYYYKQIFTRQPKGKRSKPATEERARLAEISKNIFQTGETILTQRLVIGGKPFHVVSKIAKAKDKKAEVNEVYKLLDTLHVDYKDLSGKKMIFTDEEMEQIRIAANVAFRSSLPKGVKGNEDFFEWLSAVVYESGVKVREGRDFDFIYKNVVPVLEALMAQLREKRLREKQ